MSLNSGKKVKIERYNLATARKIRTVSFYLISDLFSQDFEIYTRSCGELYSSNCEI